MKLHLNDAGVRYIISGYEAEHILVNGERLPAGLIVAPNLLDRTRFSGITFEQLDVAHFTHLATLEAAIVLLGTGSRIRFPHPSLTRPLIDARIGLEVMDTGAACRTYNILAGEGRKVVAAILA